MPSPEKAYCHDMSSKQHILALTQNQYTHVVDHPCPVFMVVCVCVGRGEVGFDLGAITSLIALGTSADEYQIYYS